MHRIHTSGHIIISSHTSSWTIKWSIYLNYKFCVSCREQVLILVSHLINIKLTGSTLNDNISQQECISVRCVPAAHWPYAGVCSWGICSRGGVVSQHALRQTPPLSTEWQTPVKNITLGTTSLQPVNIVENIKEWKNSTCWLVLVVVILWFSVLLKLMWHIIIH